MEKLDFDGNLLAQGDRVKVMIEEEGRKEIPEVYGFCSKGKVGCIKEFCTALSIPTAIVKFSNTPGESAGCQLRNLRRIN